MALTTIFIDTTEVRKSPRLDRLGWPKVLAWCREGIIDVVVSEVVLAEAQRHYRRDREAQVRELRSAAERFRSKEFEGALDVEAVEHGAAAEVAGYDAWLREKLSANRVTISPLLSVSTAALLERDLAERKPFNSSGKGFRDALIWESVLEHIRSTPNLSSGILATGNAKDFADASGALDEHLQSEVTSLGAHVSLALSLSAAAAELEDEADEELELRLELAEAASPDPEDEIFPAVIAAAERLVGTSVGERWEVPSTGLILHVPSDLDDPTVASLDIEPASFVVSAYDRYDGDTILFQAEIDAEVSVEAFATKADYFAGLEEGVELLDSDWNDHYVWVSYSVSARLRFNVTTIAGQVEEIAFDEAEPI